MLSTLRKTITTGKHLMIFYMVLLFSHLFLLKPVTNFYDKFIVFCDSRVQNAPDFILSLFSFAIFDKALAFNEKESADGTKSSLLYMISIKYEIW